MNDGLRVENLRSKGVKRLQSRRVKRAIFHRSVRDPKTLSESTMVFWLRFSPILLNGVAFVSARPFSRRRSVIGQNVQWLPALRVVRAPSLTLIDGSRA